MELSSREVKKNFLTKWKLLSGFFVCYISGKSTLVFLCALAAKHTLLSLGANK